jgi:hypothetical protein
MANGDMRYGHCGVCGAHEVYHGEVTGQLGLRPAGNLTGKRPVFNAYVCAACGHVQLHLELSVSMQSYMRRRLNRIPPQP